MLRYIATLVIALSTSWAHEKVTSLNVDFEHITDQRNLNQLYDDVCLLIQDQGVNPEKIAVILDVNKTLSHKSKQIPEAIDRVKDLSKLGVLLVVSSASVNFNRIIKRLDQWGLGQSLELGDISKTISPEELVFNDQVKLVAYHKGKAASMKRLPETERKFVHKAFSVFAVYGEKGRHVNYAFFADDLPSNWAHFKEDTIERMALGQDIKKVRIYEMQVKKS